MVRARPFSPESRQILKQRFPPLPASLCCRKRAF
jgi:hypothetical protein